MEKNKPNHTQIARIRAGEGVYFMHRAPGPTYDEDQGVES